MIWHKETSLPSGLDLVLLPGGFAYGDYLRCGAIATFSPVMKAVKQHADEGRLLVGICNGFQMLTEMHLLPGAHMRNQGLTFIHRLVPLKVENTATPFSKNYSSEKPVSFYLSNHDGNYTVDEDTLKSLEDNNQIVYRYCDAAGQVTDAANPNGATGNIAGVMNRQGNVLGLMPHPERTIDPVHGDIDGQAFFKGLLAA